MHVICNQMDSPCSTRKVTEKILDFKLISRARERGIVCESRRNTADKGIHESSSVVADKGDLSVTHIHDDEVLRELVIDAVYSYIGSP